MKMQDPRPGRHHLQPLALRPWLWGFIACSALLSGCASLPAVQPWEKGMGPKIEKAIRESDLGLNPSAQGDLLRVPMPALTEERRKDLTKVVRSAGEDCKVAVRNLRREGNEHLKRLLKDKEISEDDDRRAQEEIQRLTDRVVAEVDRLVQAKESEILAV